MSRTTLLKGIFGFLTFLLFGTFSLVASTNPITPKALKKHHYLSKFKTDSVLKTTIAPLKGSKLPYIAQTKVCFDIGWEVYKAAREQGWTNTKAFEAGNSVMMALLILKNLRHPDED